MLAAIFVAAKCQVSVYQGLSWSGGREEKTRFTQWLQYRCYFVEELTDIVVVVTPRPPLLRVQPKVSN